MEQKTEQYEKQIDYIFTSMTSDYQRPLYRMDLWGYSELQKNFVYELEQNLLNLMEHNFYQEKIEEMPSVRTCYQKRAKRLIHRCAVMCKRYEL